MKAPLPPNEPARLETLLRYHVLDTGPEQAFDDLTRLAAHICGTPIALISLVDEQRQWFKSKFGITIEQTPREGAICSHGILHSDVFLVTDTLADERFAHNPMVTGDPWIRFYAGAPLVAPDRHIIGMLCVIDRMPRNLTEEQIDALRRLGRQVISQLELRRGIEERQQAVAERQNAEESLRHRTNFLQLQQVIASAANEASSIEEVMQVALDLVCAYTGWPIGHVYLRAGTNDHELVSSTIWHFVDGDRQEALQPILVSTPGPIRDGLPYRVLERRTPAWVLEGDRDASELLSPVAARLGMKGVFAFPVLVGREVAAVLEFFSDKPTGNHDRLLQMVSYVGTQVSRVMEREHAEETLRRKEAHFRSLIEHASDVISILEADGTIRYQSPSIERFLGYKPEKLVGRDAFAMVHPDDLAAIKQLFEQAVSQDYCIQIGEFRYRHKDGSWRAFEGVCTNLLAEEAVRGLVINSRDITERKQAEQALRYRAHVENLVTAISTVFMNLKPGEVNAATQDALQTIGRFVGVDRSYVFLLADNGQTIDNTHEWCAPGIEPFIDRLQNIPVDAYPWLRDKLLQFETVHVPRVADLPPEAGGVREMLEVQKVQSMLLVPMVAGHTGVGLLGFDSVKQEKTWAEEDVALLKMIGEIFVSARQREAAEKALQESNRRLQETLSELQRTQQQVIQQERLRALGQMASGIAHDFNNALAPILGFSELLLHRAELWKDESRTRHYLTMINTASRDAASVVSRLRDFYRKREDTELLVPVDLKPLVEQAISLTQPRWKDQTMAKGIRIEVATELDKVPLITGSESDLRELLTNLIFNAVDAMPRGGTITIRARAEEDHVLLSVIDTGTGMTEEVRRRCLEPFFTTKGSLGSGLGLSMVHGIVRRHEGHIDIHTELGKGTAFTVRLPVRNAPNTKASPTPTVRSPRPLRVLVADDEPMVREVETEYLRADGHSVAVAANAHEALARFREEKFDLVILDQAMPVMSGDQLAATIKQLSAHTPVILLTGFGDMMRSAGETPPCVDLVLGKPVTIDALRQAIARALDNRESHGLSPSLP